MSNIDDVLGVSQPTDRVEVKSSAVGTVFTVLGVINLLAGVFGLFMLVAGNSEERSHGMIVSISCLSGMVICFAVASVLHFLAEIAHRLAMLQEFGAPRSRVETKNA